jgi:SAM-dependent methyltransferase
MKEISALNADYWSQLCGSRAATKLGIKPGDPSGIENFDKWFFYFYPYLHNEEFIPWKSLRHSRVLEIGLGYGSVTRRLNDKCGQLFSLDIAPKAVSFAKSTAPSANCVRGSARLLPFPNQSFDCVISIGCLHMTGNLEEGIRECMRVLKPGGQLILMVYNVFSYKRWIVAPIATLRALIADRQTLGYQSGMASPRRVSWFWDRSPSGEAPPHTEFASKRQLLRALSDARVVRATSINVDNVNDLLPRRLQRIRLDAIRVSLLRSWLSRWAGLDLYLVATK